jgi:hypothetical protein
MLKHNSKKVLDIIAGQEKRNATQAYRDVHPNASDLTARLNSYQLMQKPEAQIYLQEHIKKAQETVVALMDSDKDDIRLRASTDVLDRSHGKATQRVEQTTTGVSIVVDLTSALAAANPS